MTPDEALKLVKQLAPVCKAEGIKRFRLGELEVEFGGSDADAAAVRKFQEAFSGGVVTDEDALRWSEPGYVPSSERPPADPAPKAKGRAA